jgi:glucuronokinase
MPIAPENHRMIEAARATGASAKFAGSGGAVCGLYRDGRHYQELVDAFAALRCEVIRPIIYES